MSKPRLSAHRPRFGVVRRVGRLAEPGEGDVFRNAAAVKWRHAPEAGYPRGEQPRFQPHGKRRMTEAAPARAEIAERQIIGNL